MVFTKIGKNPDYKMTESKQLRNKELPLHLCCCHRFVGVLGNLFLNTRVETASKNLKKKEKKVIHRVIETRTCEMLCWQFDPEFPFASQKKYKTKKKRKFPVLKLSLNPSNQHCLTTNGSHQVFSYQFVKMLASNSSTSSQSIHCTWTVVRVCKLVGHSSCWLVTPF